MTVKPLKIENIPALLWGCPADRVIIAVHGSQSHKADEPIRILAENTDAMAGGCQVLSFDLPEHGARRDEAALCKVQTCVAELAAVMRWARARWQSVSLFANSIGAYFSLMAYSGEPWKEYGFCRRWWICAA